MVQGKFESFLKRPVEHGIKGVGAMFDNIFDNMLDNPTAIKNAQAGVDERARVQQITVKLTGRIGEVLQLQRRKTTARHLALYLFAQHQAGEPTIESAQTLTTYVERRLPDVEIDELWLEQEQIDGVVDAIVINNWLHNTAFGELPPTPAGDKPIDIRDKPHVIDLPAEIIHLSDRQPTLDSVEAARQRHPSNYSE